MNIYLLDNFDSFTYNLVDQFRSLGHQVYIYRNDLNAEYLAEKILADNDAVLVLSPGPGAPKNAGCMMKLIELVSGQLPILGICLGHQALVEHYGGKVDKAPQTIHGKASPINHTMHKVFGELPSLLPVARYHSLVATQVPSSLEVIAYTESLPMAIAHKQHPVLGFQFHPESILTTRGSELLIQSLTYLSTFSGE
ncbi:aminodeoxychorismate/anthranilate synthase component II [Parashewanella curva]|uniref:anthranilate synthase n=1 Tax=Parashewanella curva TaxID=2338552 RepID=A0A3L8Q2K7_9GAMM|nr:aminodeoxychorismate/anthranilate synthase component II [Parashewanella curva]RLV61103.1 aminodeoxychorismate/anthranilate synthase component II [Parashewanella curva]